jgi:hypothetical protein
MEQHTAPRINARVLDARLLGRAADCLDLPGDSNCFMPYSMPMFTARSVLSIYLWPLAACLAAVAPGVAVAGVNVFFDPRKLLPAFDVLFLVSFVLLIAVLIVAIIRLVRSGQNPNRFKRRHYVFGGLFVFVMFLVSTGGIIASTDLFAADFTGVIKQRPDGSATYLYYGRTFIGCSCELWTRPPGALLLAKDYGFSVDCGPRPARLSLTWNQEDKQMRVIGDDQQPVPRGGGWGPH